MYIIVHVILLTCHEQTASLVARAIDGRRAKMFLSGLHEPENAVGKPLTSEGDNLAKVAEMQMQMALARFCELWGRPMSNSERLTVDMLMNILIARRVLDRSWS